MSQFGQRGGSTFFKNVPNSKISQRSEGGGGSTLIGTLSQIFLIFYLDGSPKEGYRVTKEFLNIDVDII